MLRTLTIENYAIIESLDITFERGLNIITGQTGAGKSILLGALSLLSGARADVSVLLDKSRSCIVEGTFEVSGYNLQGFFAKYDLDYDDTVIIRRQVNTSGKSRAFISDQPVSQGVLKELSVVLIDIHSQHQSLLISHRDFQIKVLDSIACQIDRVEDYRRRYDSLCLARKRLVALKATALQERQRLDLLNHYVDEIELLGVRSGEVEALTQELAVLSNASQIVENVSAAFSLADEAEIGFLSLIHRAQGHLSSVGRYYQPVSGLSDRLSSCYIELQDISSECFDIAQNMEINPLRVEQVEMRLDSINSLLHKHDLEDTDQLIALRERFDNEIWDLSQQENEIESLEAQISQMDGEVRLLAQEISSRRGDVIPKIESQISLMLKDLGIKDARLEILMEPVEINSFGQDSVRFLFSANALSAPQPIEKVASGGEISRLMLSLKGLMSRSVNLTTIIFDEIDTGVSGQIADRMGEIMTQMGEYMQVINITHLPQVASKGENHFYVYKEDSGASHIRRLTSSERVEKIAEMLSGANITEAAISQACSLLSR
ncbi:MAG: DNA repair protein RecN [Rikenellaceae bacterium]